MHQEGEDAAGENRRIRSQRAAARAERDRNLEHEHQREREAQPPARPAAQDHERQQRPEEIELLLDPERPREREDDVRPGEERHLGERGQVPRHGLEEGAPVPGGDPDDAHGDDVQREADDVDRHDPEKAPHEERAPAQRAERVLLAQGQRRDQEAAEDEEERHAVPALEPAPEPVRPTVVEDDEQRRDPAQTFERREERCRAPRAVARNPPRSRPHTALVGSPRAPL